MDAYFRSVGFSKIRLSKQMDKIKKEILDQPDKRNILGVKADTVYTEYFKMYGHGIGLLANGNMDEMENIKIEACIPYAVADENTAVNKYLVEYIDDEPVIVYEDEDTGNELVFKLQNVADYLRDKKRFISRGIHEGEKFVNVAGLSIYGTVILPVAKDDVEEQMRVEEEDYYKNLVLRFRDGDDEAAELLKMYAEETSDIIRERLKDEDFLSVVEGYFLPMEDNELDYSILGDIMDSETIQNSTTKEEVHKLVINITGTKLQLYINKKDIIGLPITGMRFMGTCRLQGCVVPE